MKPNPKFETAPCGRGRVGHFQFCILNSKMCLLVAASTFLGFTSALSQGPVLEFRPSDTNQAALSWFAHTNAAYVIERASVLTNWGVLTIPQAAPPGGGALTGLVQTILPQQFYRVAALPLTNSPVPATPGIYTNLGLVHAGVPRQYWLAIPSGYTGATSAPLALILHGHGQTASLFATRHPDLFTEAETRGLILALPQGLETIIGTEWNNSDPEVGQSLGGDDLGFLLALIERLDGALNLDPQRFYAGGFSAGGAMCHYLGARTTNVFAALAAVGSGLGRGAPDRPFVPPPAAGPMPVLTVNATNDCGWPYWGGLYEGFLVTAAFDAVSYWTNANGCTPPATVMTNFVVGTVNRINACGDKPPENQVQTNAVVALRWSSCLAGVETVFITLTDGGHQWPDASAGVGFDANQAVLDFFLRHARP
jgi:polyhydroxybutyrate depolymerase